MVYISSDGKVYNKQPWNIGRFLSIFVGFFMAIIMFLKTLITPFTNPDGYSSPDDSRRSGGLFRWGGGGGGGGGSGGGGSGGMGPPRPPKRPMGRINHTPSVSVPGGCSGGSCGM